MSNPVQVLFICLGNICRSPTAHGVFESLVACQGLADQIVIDSAGTGDWHIGRAPDPRAQQAAQRRGHDIAHLRARQVTPGDFSHFDYILAMDHANLDDLQAMRPQWYQGHLGLFLDFAPGLAGSAVPDPYYGGEEGFDQVFDMVDAASRGLLDHIRQHHPGLPQEKPC